MPLSDCIIRRQLVAERVGYLLDVEARAWRCGVVVKIRLHCVNHFEVIISCKCS